MLKYSEFDKSHSKIPEAKLNGGLYTGEPFKGPWGNVYIKPDTIYMTNALQKAPPKATTQYPNMIRPGNNDPDFKNVHNFSNKHNIVCTGSVKKTPFKSFNPFDSIYSTI